MEHLKSYLFYLVGDPVRHLYKRLRLWHLEVTHGSQVGYLDEARELSDDIREVRTEKWRRRAWLNRLELPPKDDDNNYWTEKYLDPMGEGGSKTQLSNGGIRFILDQYRKELGTRREIKLK